MRNNHVKKMKNYIETIMFNGQCKITHKDILRETNANCCYSVLKGLKKYYDVKENWISKENCRFKEYIFKSKKEQPVINIGVYKENVQLSLLY